MGRLAAFALIILLAGTASADRLGGAFRGEYGDPEVRVGPGGVPIVPHGKTGVREVHAYWTFFFEHNREWLLNDRISALRALRRGSEGGPPAHWQTLVLPVLQAATTDPVAEVRDAAILALGKGGGEEVIPILAKCLLDVDPELCEDTLLALGLTGSKAAAPHLLEFLPDPELRSFAALGLALLGDSTARSALLSRFESAVEDDRNLDAAVLATALGHLQLNEDELDRLAMPLKSRGGNRTPLKTSICHALGLLEMQRGRAWLDRATVDKSSEVQAAAVLAMGAPQSVKEAEIILGKRALRGGNRMSQVFAQYGLALPSLPPGAKAEAREEQLRAARAPAKYLYRAQHAALALGLAGCKDASDYFVNILTSNDRRRLVFETQTAYAMALGLLGDRRAAESLLEVLRDEASAPDLRSYFALSLALLNHDAALPEIRKALTREEAHPLFVTIACHALALLGDQNDVPLLLSIMKSTKEGWREARGAAAVALGLIAGEESIEELTDLVGELEDPLTRAFSIVALGWMVDKDPVPRIPLLYRRYHYRVGTIVFREVMSCL